MLAKSLVFLFISSLLSSLAASPLPLLQDHADSSAEVDKFNVTSSISSPEIDKRTPGTVELNLIGCTMDVITWAEINPGRLTAKEGGPLYGSIIPKGGLYLAVDPNDADLVGQAFRCSGGKYTIAKYDFDGTGLRIIDMTTGQRFDVTAHAVIGYFDPARAGIRANHKMKMYVLQNPLAIAHLKLKRIEHYSG
ncbi:hypothetical protein F5878DRAFT_599211 [Lentinula raphanica]|uniref:Uncharacterized protein n=1 Tax=Lentinula raphanica TaxID=153919 RepID=A0AA38ULB9_9AGAR|nr:hypothetical protein F5880DRAFT_1283231 [Lentinula raphanica]KAJ3845444.1 hypothetical protein F5878DRAFT_599211 [Lentinula raphanica]